MGLTLTNVNTLSLLNILNRTSADQTTSLQRLSTGSRINSGKDDPAGLIALSSLQSELTNVNASITNNQRTDSILTVADKALNEVVSLLDEVQSLALASANKDGLSGSEIAANQAQIDNALEAIDRIIGSTEFNGKKLLDGSLGITTTGVDTTKLTDVRVFNRPSSSADLTVSVTAAASQATHALATGVASADATISVQGKDGTATFDILSGEALSSVAAKINSGTAQTGVTASANASGTNLTLISSDFGTDAFVRVSTVQGQQAAITDGEDFGVNASVTVNGQNVAVDGKDVHYQSNGASASFTLTDGYNDGTITGDEVFTISGGGATFQLGTTTNSRVTVGISGLYSQQLGSASGGYLSTIRGGGANSVVNDATAAAQIAAKAKAQIAQVQGRIGGFQRFQVSTAINQQTAAKESLTSAIGVIRDVDYAEETANLSRQNVLLQSAISLLGVANQQSSQVLSLLR